MYSSMRRLRAPATAQHTVWYRIETYQYVTYISVAIAVDGYPKFDHVTGFCQLSSKPLPYPSQNARPLKTHVPLFYSHVRLSSPMPHSRRILYTNLISKQNLCARATFPASVASSREHEFAGGIDMNGAEHTAAMTGDDGEGDGWTVAVRRCAG